MKSIHNKITPSPFVSATANLYVLHFFFANLKYLSKSIIRRSGPLILWTKWVRKIISFWENGVHSIAYLTAVISCRHLLRLKLWFRFRLKIWNAISRVGDFIHTCRHPWRGPPITIHRVSVGRLSPAWIPIHNLLHSSVKNYVSL